MKLLKCKVCGGEVEIINNDRSVNKKIKCLDCGFNNIDENTSKKIEIVVLKRRSFVEKT